MFVGQKLDLNWINLINFIIPLLFFLYSIYVHLVALGAVGVAGGGLYLFPIFALFCFLMNKHNEVKCFSKRLQEIYQWSVLKQLLSKL